MWGSRTIRSPPSGGQRESSLLTLVRIHFIIVMIRWTGLVPWEFEFPFPGSLTSTFLGLGTRAFVSETTLLEIVSRAPRLQGYLAHPRS